jgi:hypothetical protein
VGVQITAQSSIGSRVIYSLPRNGFGTIAALTGVALSIQKIIDIMGSFLMRSLML